LYFLSCFAARTSGLSFYLGMVIPPNFYFYDTPFRRFTQDLKRSPVEMAVAKLDYSSSHVSYILHQFEWLKLVDTQVNDDNSYSYQLKVNPKDDPELFSAA